MATPPVQCPHCGYDLRGHAPVQDHVTCPECGQSICWSELISPTGPRGGFQKVVRTVLYFWPTPVIISYLAIAVRKEFSDTPLFWVGIIGVLLMNLVFLFVLCLTETDQREQWGDRIGDAWMKVIALVFLNVALIVVLCGCLSFFSPARAVP